jgi:hypothetical protein
MRFVDGALTALRPVFEQDLAQLAHLLNASPVPIFDTPIWTEARLKKKYSDEKEPGLWGRSKRWYAVTRQSDKALIGAIIELTERTGETGLLFQFAEGDDQDALAQDALKAYVDYRTGFYTTPRINVEFCAVEEDKQRWIEGLGFVYQARIPASLLWLGEYRDILFYSWIPEWVLALRAPDGGAKE